MDIKPYSFEPLATIFIDSINFDELASANGNVDLEQSPLSLTPDPGSQQELDW